MQVVWKFPLSAIGTVSEIEMPVGAEILRPGIDGEGKGVVWAKVTDEAPKGIRRLYVERTGTRLEHDGKYIGSVVVESLGALWQIFHVFDLGWKNG
jgi:hypothetical protein